MVSLQAALSPKERKTSPNNAEKNPSKKRKWEDGGESENNFAKEMKPWMMEHSTRTSNIELHLETPLPLDWQRCLDIKSGQIHFYNIRTQKRTSKDPRESPEPPSPCPISLDLELNLTCESPRSHVDQKERSKQELGGMWCNSRINSSGISRSLSWASLDADHREMVATVCMRCHMLVLMCTTSPSCPNCKFVHLPEDRSSPRLLKPEFRLLCCKD